jgi:Sulfatase-modifying factor enzyme 1
MNSIKTRNKVFILCVILLLAILLALLLFGLLRRGGQQPGGVPPVQRKGKDTLAVANTHTGAVPETTAARAPIQYAAKTDTAAGARRPHGAGSGKNAAFPGAVDTMLKAGASGIAETAGVQRVPPESAVVAAADTAGTGRARVCAGDTTPPWVYPDPAGGLHRHAVHVVLSATKPCVIEWKSDSAAPLVVYKGDTINIASSTTLFFRAHDSCGNVMDEREEFYEISTEETAKYCPPDMEFVKAGQTRFCIDHYEWPNRLKAMPLSFVSLYSAVDSCVSVGKRLCTSDEWTLACTGPYGWKYPYGNSYEPLACVSHDTTARPSGSKPECRGYFEVFDMAGNLAEWTNTRSDRNQQFFNVRGGFWESGPHTGCFDVRYSYYPQNRHNPVGFRCCKAASSQ